MILLDIYVVYLFLSLQVNLLLCLNRWFAYETGSASSLLLIQFTLGFLPALVLEQNLWT